MAEPGRKLDQRLFDAVYYGNTALVYKCIFDGADVTYRNEAGNQCIHAAARAGSGKLVGILLNAGADVNAKGRINNTPLHYAVINGDRNLVKQLLVAGADATQVNLKGKNPRDLCLAAVEDPTKNNAMVDLLDSWVLQRCNFLNKLVLPSSPKIKIAKANDSSNSSSRSRSKSKNKLDVKQEKLLAAVEPLIADARKLAKSPPVQRTSPFRSRLAEKISPGRSSSPLSFSGGRRTPPNVQTSAESVVDSTPQGVNGYYIEMDGKKLFIQEDVEEEEDSASDEDDAAEEGEEDAPEVDGPELDKADEEKVAWDVEVSLDASRGIGVQLQEFNEFTRIVNIDPKGQAFLAGAKKGDLIKMVNGKSMKGKLLKEVMSALKAEAGDQLSLALERSSSKEKAAT